ncbi:PKD domain-containing protein, partial [Patescibacteria group bacterium]|nr:PKD domain-containing protein [Patescibacteria group bacterium]
NSPAYVGTGTAQIAGENYCNFSPIGQIIVQWKYQDNDGDSQSQYNIQVATDSSFNNKTIDCVVNQIVSSNDMGTSAARAVLSPSNVCNDGGLLGNRSLEINYRGSANPYYWRVRVKAGSGNLNWSDFENGQTSIVTPSHPYPLVDFNPVPSNPLVDEMVLFVQDGSDTENTNSFCYAGGEGPCQNKPTPPVTFFWDFGNTQIASTKGNATTSYDAKGTYNVALRISDDVGACTATKSINIKKPSLPKWKEVSP